MKRSHSLMLAGALSVMCGAAVASISPGSLNPFPQRVLPVLVQVNAEGKVTSASPAIALEPRMSRLLSQSLDDMITAPAEYHGRPIASQFILNLQLDATRRPDGDYDARFVSVSTQPVPAGNWHWVNIDGRMWALAGPDGRAPFQRIRTMEPIPRNAGTLYSPAGNTAPASPRAAASPAAHHP